MLLHILLRHLSRPRYLHSLRVARLAVRLARRHGADPDRAWVAGLMHDLAREMSGEEMRFWVFRLLPEERLMDAALLHGPVAALMLKDKGIGDEEVWEAVAAHTTGAPGMGLLALVVYVADHAEPGRIFPGAEAARRLAFRDLRAAGILLMEETIRHLEARGRPVHPRSREALEWLRLGSAPGLEANTGGG